MLLQPVCHGPRLSSFRWRSCLGWHSASISASVFLAFFSRVVPSPESVFRRSLGLASLRGQTTWVALSCTSQRYSLVSTFSLSLMFVHKSGIMISPMIRKYFTRNRSEIYNNHARLEFIFLRCNLRCDVGNLCYKEMRTQVRSMKTNI